MLCSSVPVAGLLGGRATVERGASGHGPLAPSLCACYRTSYMRSIVQIGNTILRRAADPVPLSDIGTVQLQNLIAEMKTLLAAEEYGVALAAPQVGEPIRLFIVSGSGELKRKRSTAKRDADADDAYRGMPVVDEVYINPVITKMSRAKTDKHEGCLSVRGKWGHVPRAEKVTLQAFNERGEKITRGAAGFLAHIFQHEVDHLDGILYVDKATDMHEDEN